ncbi:Fibrinogen-like protein A [Holothuria leucospilota]|uniref:Fibrinogen-like protein A n=1 Tax=Holothuria leucospilota TaxID=206669 RepID=A0A9Q0YI76_HOLLE|nr:Fibrinogen-like protein A [Holothuria leucospilota]
MKFAVVLLFIFGCSLIDITSTTGHQTQEDVPRTLQEKTVDIHSCCKHHQSQYPRDCKEIYDKCRQSAPDGIYLIQPDDAPEPFKVFCNNNVDGGGWTVLQRRLDGSIDFFRNWDEYKRGFGFLGREFWLGNDKISYLTNQKDYELRIDLNNKNGNAYYAKYDLFRISDEIGNYKLVGLGQCHSGSTAGCNGLESSRNHFFSTRDRENDLTNNRHCAEYTTGAWWYDPSSTHRCGDSMLNNQYNPDGRLQSIRWWNLPENNYFIKYTEMKIRPLQRQ